jgi:hypothetical protein
VSYVTVDEFKIAVGVADTVDDANIQRALDAAANWIEDYCGRVFNAVDTLASARIFDAPLYGPGAIGSSGPPPYSWFYGGGAWLWASGMDRLTVPDVGSVTGIAIDLNLDGSFSQSLPSGSWMLYPLNIGQPGVNGNYTEIRLRPNAPYAFWPGYQVRVTGFWGFPADDAGFQQIEPVRQANIILANRHFRRPSAPFGVWEGPQMGTLAYLPANDPDVRALLGPFMTKAVSPNWVMV